jgi:hypothetical protein
LLPAIAAGAAVCTAIGLSGIGDAPHPHAPAATISSWFAARHDDVLQAAPFGYAGAIGVAATVAMLAARLGRDPAARALRGVVVIGGLVAAAYLAAAHALWTATAYLAVHSSPDAAASTFVVTITAVPLLGIGMTVGLGALALGALRTRALPRWWTVASGAIAILAAVAPLATAESGFLSPDVQQQTCGNALLVWLLVTAIATATRTFRATASPS